MSVFYFDGENKQEILKKWKKMLKRIQAHFAHFIYILLFKV